MDCRNHLLSEQLANVRAADITGATRATASDGDNWIQTDSPPKSYSAFLQHDLQGAVVENVPAVDSDETHKLKVAPLFSCAVHAFANSTVQSGPDSVVVFPQYGVLGLQRERLVSTGTKQKPRETIIFNNIEEPFSTFICGSQGSGKSHTLSCLLENSLLPSTATGVLDTPLTGLVFHYDNFAGYDVGQVCESAYLCTANVRVKVLVAPTSLKKMRGQYYNLQGVSESAPRPTVMPLYFSERQLSVDMMMTLMAVQDTGIAAPLYISTIRQVLRETALSRQDDPGFDYTDFRHRLADLALSEGQCAPLNLRLELLESFLLAREQSAEALEAFDATWRFEPGTLTIIDLSDQFVNETDACALFSICLKLFMNGWRSNPRAVVLDEAHKFLGNTSEASKLTKDLISIIRQQRHLNARVVIATQEPTLAGDLLDLCNVSIVHRFSSPKWYSTIKAHIAGTYCATEDAGVLFQRITSLRTGEAMVCCPTAVLMGHARSPRLLGSEVMWLKVRLRISADGGRSIRATDRFSTKPGETLSHLPSYAQLNGKSLPRPGSSAGRIHRTRRPSTVASMKGPPQTLASTRQAQPASVTSASDGFSLEDSHSVAAARLSISTIAIGKDVTPSRQNEEVSQLLLDERLRASLLSALQSNPALYAQNPQPHLKAILRNVSVQCNLPPKYLKGHDVLWDGKLVRPTTILKRLLEQYCDDQGIPHSQRANLSWLR